MRKTLFSIALLSLIALFGCSSKPDMRSEPVKFSGKVKSATPIQNVMLTFMPNEDGHPCGVKVGANGEFSGEAIPGKYSFYFSADETQKGKGEANLKAVPETYRSSNAEHSIRITSGSDLVVEVK